MGETPRGVFHAILLVVKSSAKSVAEYLKSLPDDRRAAIEAVRAVVRKNLDKGYEEGIQYGMIGYYVPHRLYPAGYYCDPKQPLPFAAIAAQKSHMAIYLMCVYLSKDLEELLRAEWKKSGKKLDMGKSCIRFKKLEDVALEAIGKVIKKVPAKKYIAVTEKIVADRAAEKAARKKPASRA